MLYPELRRRCNLWINADRLKDTHASLQIAKGIHAFRMVFRLTVDERIERAQLAIAGVSWIDEATSPIRIPDPNLQANNRNAVDGSG